MNPSGTSSVCSLVMRLAKYRTPPLPLCWEGCRRRIHPSSSFHGAHSGRFHYVCFSMGFTQYGSPFEGCARRRHAPSSAACSYVASSSTLGFSQLVSLVLELYQYCCPVCGWIISRHVRRASAAAYALCRLDSASPAFSGSLEEARLLLALPIAMPSEGVPLLPISCSGVARPCA